MDKNSSVIPLSDQQRWHKLLKPGVNDIHRCRWIEDKPKGSGPDTRFCGIAVANPSGSTFERSYCPDCLDRLLSRPVARLSRAA
jgi:hypothetical protein